MIALFRSCLSRFVASSAFYYLTSFTFWLNSDIVCWKWMWGTLEGSPLEFDNEAGWGGWRVARTWVSLCGLTKALFLSRTVESKSPWVTLTISLFNVVGATLGEVLKSNKSLLKSPSFIVWQSFLLGTLTDGFLYFGILNWSLFSHTVSRACLVSNYCWCLTVYLSVLL